MGGVEHVSARGGTPSTYFVIIYLKLYFHFLSTVSSFLLLYFLYSFRRT